MSPSYVELLQIIVTRFELPVESAPRNHSKKHETHKGLPARSNSFFCEKFEPLHNPNVVSATQQSISLIYKGSLNHVGRPHLLLRKIWGRTPFSVRFQVKSQDCSVPTIGKCPLVARQHQ
jgi:hypothetical protein